MNPGSAVDYAGAVVPFPSPGPVMVTRLAAVLVAFALAPAAAQEKGKADKKKEPTLGDKVVEFCKARKGKPVGDGECAALATEALRAAGAAGRGPDDPDPGDYTWGKLVFTYEAGRKPVGKLADVKPGAVIQFRDASWVTREGNRISSASAPHHTGVVTAVDRDRGVLRYLHQNHNGRRFVVDGVLPLRDLRGGWVRVYEPVPAGNGPSREPVPAGAVLRAPIVTDR